MSEMNLLFLLLRAHVRDFPGLGQKKPGHLFSDGNLYCKMCYTKHFGPQTRSASDIEHKIIDTSIIKNEDPKKNCPR